MLSAVLIDDEASNSSSLQAKLNRYCPAVNVIAVCENADDGIRAIESLHPDIVFLDIEMPVKNGFVMLQQLTYKNFALIFVTAYDHYAIRAIRFSALDYLVKPVEIEELIAAVGRVPEKKTALHTSQQMEILLGHVATPGKEFSKLAVSSTEGIRFINTTDILYLKASINYTYIHLPGKHKLIMSRTLKDVEELLDPAIFLRIHNSFIINRNYINRYIRGDGGQVMMTDGTMLDVSKRKKAAFLKAMSSR